MATKEGWLTKEGGSWKTWKKRYCTLENDCLCYYTKKAGELKGSIPLKTCGKIAAVDYKKKKNCFVMQTPNRDYHMITETEAERDSWVEQLRLAQNEVKSSGTSSAAAAATSTTATSTAAKAGSANGKGEGDKTDNKVKVNDFESLKVIGRGSFGKVLQVRYLPTGQIFAMKVLNKKTIIERGELDHTKAEKNILMKLENPFLVRLHYAFQTPDRLYFVMDFINGGELFFHLQKEKTFNPDRVRFYAAEIVLGLEYLHKQGVIYRDLKPENLLLTADGHICMTDFGISKEGLHCKDDRTATFCGTPEYLAPEVLEGKGYGKEVDWWSFGTLVYEMLTGLPPFYSEDVQLMYSKIMNAKLNIPKKIGPEARSLLEGLLTRDPSERLADPDLIKAHPYFKDIDWEKLSKKEMPPPYMPNVNSELDTGNIDPVFTEEPAALSPSEDSELSKTIQQNFDGFTYVAGGGEMNTQN
ncbi:PHprotein kinase domain containing protein [Balamuthia mandrillaris]